MKRIKNQYILIPGIIFLVIVLVLVLIYFRIPTFLFPKAETYDVTGQWQINTQITSPSSENGQQLANLTQGSSGSFTGTISEMDGSSPTSISGTVSGSHIVTNPIPFSGTQTGISYEGTCIYDGTISSGSNSMSGNISGTLTKPYNSPIVGTFTATRLSGLPPTATPIPTTYLTPSPSPTSISTNTPASTATPTGSGFVATTPATTNRTPIPGYTNPPVPVSGASFPTVIGIGAGVAMLGLALVLIF